MTILKKQEKSKNTLFFGLEKIISRKTRFFLNQNRLRYDAFSSFLKSTLYSFTIMSILMYSQYWFINHFSFYGGDVLEDGWEDFSIYPSFLFQDFRHKKYIKRPKQLLTLARVAEIKTNFDVAGTKSMFLSTLLQIIYI